MDAGVGVWACHSLGGLGGSPVTGSLTHARGGQPSPSAKDSGRARRGRRRSRSRRGGGPAGGCGRRRRPRRRNHRCTEGRDARPPLHRRRSCVTPSPRFHRRGASAPSASGRSLEMALQWQPACNSATVARGRRHGADRHPAAGVTLSRSPSVAAVGSITRLARRSRRVRCARRPVPHGRRFVPRPSLLSFPRPSLLSFPRALRSSPRPFFFAHLLDEPLDLARLLVSLARVLGVLVLAQREVARQQRVVLLDLTSRHTPPPRSMQTEIASSGAPHPVCWAARPAAAGAVGTFGDEM